MQGRPSLQADHADCVGPHLAEGASACGGGLSLRRGPQLAEGASSEAQMRRTYSVSAQQFRRCEAPLAPSPSTLATQRASSYNFAWGHKLARGGPV